MTRSARADFVTAFPWRGGKKQTGHLEQAAHQCIVALYGSAARPWSPAATDPTSAHASLDPSATSTRSMRSVRSCSEGSV